MNSYLQFFLDLHSEMQSQWEHSHWFYLKSFDPSFSTQNAMEEEYFI